MWKEHYSQMERTIQENKEEEEYQPRSLEDWARWAQETHRNSSNNEMPNSQKRKPILKRDLEALLTTHALVERKLEEQRIKAAAKDIVKIDPTNVGIDNNSIISYSIKALNENKSLNLDELISKVEELGWNIDFIEWKRNIFKKMLSSNFHLFNKQDEKFQLRIGLTGEKPAKEEVIFRKKSDKIPTLRSIIFDIANTYQTEDGITPIEIYSRMLAYGYSISYTYLQRVLQGHEFIKNGSYYRTINKDKEDANALLLSPRHDGCST
jgi:hypothetical protein